MKPKIHGDRSIYRGRIIHLVSREATLNGRRRPYDVVLHPGAVSVVPMVDRATVALIRQYRVSVGKKLYEVVAGTREPGESPRVSARRELIEEAGLRAGKLTELARFYTAPGFCTEWMFMYLATSCTPVPARPEADEVIERVDVPLRDAVRMVRRGQILDAKSIVGVLLAADRLTRGSR